MPLQESMWLYDFGIVDANDDDLLDIYTTNHNWRGTLLIADEDGGYRDVYSEWGLDQSQDFPGLELSLTPPLIAKPGLYIYWLGEKLILRTYKISELGSVEGKLHSWYEPEIVENEGFNIERTISKIISGTKFSNTTIKFSATGDKVLKLKPSPQFPIRFNLSGSLPATHIYVGNEMVSPKRTDFSLQLRDRHAMAWTDFNDDGQMDVYISRGGMSGYLNVLPQDIVDVVKDELLVSKGTNKYHDLASELGIVKGHS